MTANILSACAHECEYTPHASTCGVKGDVRCCPHGHVWEWVVVLPVSGRDLWRRVHPWIVPFTYWRATLALRRAGIW